MSGPQRVVVAFGTRPEAAKMAPVVAALAAHPATAPYVLATGQQREQVRDVLAPFGLTPDEDLDVMTDRQGSADLVGRIVPAFAERLRALAPAYLLVHGDTTTTFAAALAGFYGGVPVGHVEAGLRSFDLTQPFPEEGNRRLVDAICDLALAPTEGARANLRREGRDDATVLVTGNTGVDAVRAVAGRAPTPPLPGGTRGRVTVTLHRRENLEHLPAFAAAIARVARAHPDLAFVWPVHRNPAVREAVLPAVRDVPNVIAGDPLDYEAMVATLAASRLIVTDSGGLQEEGAALGVPVAVLRAVTERPEGVEAGVLRLVGTDPAAVEADLRTLLAPDAPELAAMRERPNPYGDGAAAPRVAAAVAWRLGVGPRPADWRGPVLPSSP